MSSIDWLATASSLAVVQEASSLHARIVGLAEQDPATGRVALYVDELGELAQVAGTRCSVPLDQAPDEGAAMCDGWRLVALRSGGLRHGVLALERSTSAPMECVAPHIGAALGAASTYAMLEELVQREMATAIAREQAVQLILDNMTEGLLVVDLDGVATPVRSAVTASWLGDVPEGEPIWRWLAGDPALAERLSTNFCQIAWDLLPFEVTASQMPARIRRADRTYRLAYSQVFEDGAFERVLISVSDITAELQAERDEAARREMEQVLKTLLANVEGFREGLDEVQRLIGRLGELDTPVLRARALHTIKGSGAILGFTRFAEEVHAIEDVLADDPDAWGPDLRVRLEGAWATSFDFVRPLVAQDDSGVSLHAEEYEQFTAMLQTHQVAGAVVQAAQSWSCPSIAGTFDRFARLVERRCHKTGLQVDVQTTGCRVRVRGEGQAAAVASLVHVLRNSLEHGLELPEERRAAGKSATATLLLAAEDVGTSLRITIEDDGRGVDVPKVREVGRRAGLPEDASLLACLCAGTTRTSADLGSGRGVGMAAVRDAVSAIGGAIEVYTTPGQGTRFVLELPTHPRATALA